MAFVSGASTWLSKQYVERLNPRRPRQYHFYHISHQRILSRAEIRGSEDDFVGDPTDNSTPRSAPSSFRDASKASGESSLVRFDNENDNGVNGSDNEHLTLVKKDISTESIDSGGHPGEFLNSPSLNKYLEERQEGIPRSTSALSSEWSDTWALSVDARRGFELKNQYSRVGILIELNFSDFEPAEDCMEAYKNATLQEIALTKARAVYEATRLPCIAEMSDMSIDPPEPGSRLNKSLQQGYYTRNIATEADTMLDRVRPISDENRLTRFSSVAVYFDGENEVVAAQSVDVAMAFSAASKSLIASTGALDSLFKELTRKFGLTLISSDGTSSWGNNLQRGKKGKVMIGATLLRERIVREGKILGDGIIKVSSFLNHMVDTDLVEVCGEELAERLRHTMPNKVLTVESTGLIAGLPTARKLGIPLVFARKSRPITISDSYQTTYRSSTKGVTSELIVSCEYLESGDRVLVIDDFLAGGSTVEGLFKLVRMAHAKVVGVGVLIEKMTDGGRAFLSGYDVPVESLAKVSAEGNEGRISIVDEEPWVPPNSKMNEDRVREEAMRAKAEYYDRTEDDGLTVMENVKSMGHMQSKEKRDTGFLTADSDNDVEDNDDVEIDVIRWENDDMLDEIEEDLIRENDRR